MNANQFTQKSLEAIQTAQRLAQEKQNAYLTPEHILYRLLTQNDGLIPSLFGKLGVNCTGLANEVLEIVEKLPRLSSASFTPIAISGDCSSTLSIMPQWSASKPATSSLKPMPRAVSLTIFCIST